MTVKPNALISEELLGPEKSRILADHVTRLGTR